MAERFPLLTAMRAARDNRLRGQIDDYEAAIKYLRHQNASVKQEKEHLQKLLENLENMARRDFLRELSSMMAHKVGERLFSEIKGRTFKVINPGLNPDDYVTIRVTLFEVMQMDKDSLFRRILDEHGRKNTTFVYQNPGDAQLMHHVQLRVDIPHMTYKHIQGPLG